MIARSIGYLLVVLVSVYLFFMYDGTIWTGLLILELLYPVCSGQQGLLRGGNAGAPVIVGMYT